MRFLANENFPLPSVRLLREAGHDVVSISEETPGITDSQVLSRAVSEQRIILTFDRDYGVMIYRPRNQHTIFCVFCESPNLSY